MASTSNPEMTKTYSARLRQRGQVTIPQAVREALSLEQGDILTLVQVSETILMTSRQSRTRALAEQFSAIMDEDGVTLADLLIGLDKEREALWRQR